MVQTSSVRVWINSVARVYELFNIESISSLITDKPSKLVTGQRLKTIKTRPRKRLRFHEGYYFVYRENASTIALLVSVNVLPSIL